MMNYLQRKKLAFMSIVNSVKGFVRNIVGQFPLTLPHCVDGKSIIGYKIYGNSVQLPSQEYSPLSYIQSSGTQYIDTGVVANQNTGFEIEFITNNAIDSSGFGCIFGARTKSNTNEYQLTSFRADSTADYEGTFRFGTVSYDGGIKTGVKNIISLKNGKYTKQDGSETTLEGNFATPCSITVFALNNNGTPTQYGKIQLFKFKLYDGDTLLRDFIPCYRTADKTIGLYDLVENKFYVNKGTGSFARSDIVRPDNPVEVKSVGEYDETSGKYKIPITAKGANQEPITTNIFLDEPLYKVGSYADYIDFENKKVVRKVGYNQIKSNYTYPMYNEYTFYKNTSVDPNWQTMKDGNKQAGFCNYLENSQNANSPIWFGTTSNGNQIIYIAMKDLCANYDTIAKRQQAFRDWLAGLEIPFMVYYILESETTQSIELPDILTFKGTTILATDADTQPSNVELTYFSTQKGE